MPRTIGFSTKQKMDHQNDVLIDDLELLLFKNKISKSKVAKEMGITPQAVCSQFKNKSITIPVLMMIITLTNAPAETVKNMLEVKGIQ